LREKETGKIVNVLSTHGILTGNQAKFEQMNLAKKIMKNLSETYGGKTILMGDMNYDEGGRYYQNVVSGTGYADAKYLAKNYTYRVTAAHFGKYPYGAVNNPWDDQSSIIDFVFVEEGTQVETYKVIDQEYYNNGEVVHISDHSAVLVDLYI
jgi:endonuclease/exonuclease/phosphatase family metal-dependent hydrolase